MNMTVCLRTLRTIYICAFVGVSSVLLNEKCLLCACICEQCDCVFVECLLSVCLLYVQDYMLGACLSISVCM